MTSGVKVQAVVFDLDDTLYAERDFAFSGFAAVAHAFADALGDEQEAVATMRRLFDSPHRRRVFDRLLEEHGASTPQGAQDRRRALVEAMIRCYRDHVPGISLLPDAAAALDRLHGKFRLGLITDGFVTTQRHKIHALGLQAWMDEMIVTDEIGIECRKPSPVAFERMARRLGVDPACCVYVADNVAKDFVAPNALGWTTVRVRRGDGIYDTAETAAGGEPQHVIDSLDALDEVMPW